MEAIENSLVEGGILWLAQILESLFISGKLDEWICQVGLAEAIQKLRIEIERVETVVAAVKGRAIGNKPLARSLARIRELMYDADNVVDELDYFRLQQQVEGGATACPSNEPEGMGLNGAELLADGTSDNPDIPSSSKKRINRSKAWNHFVEKRNDKGNIYAAECKCCHALIKCGGTSGTNGLNKHIRKNGKCLGKPPPDDRPPTPTSIGVGSDSISRKRIRVDDEATDNIVSNTPPWHKARFSNRIRQIVLQLQDIRRDVNEFLNDSTANSNQYRNNTSYISSTTSSLIPQKVYGRDTEKDYIIRVMTAAGADLLSVLPIVGIGGVGKTTLAQLVYNDPTVINQYERAWIWVSNDIDKKTITRDILDFISHENHERINNYAKLQEILKGHMEKLSKRSLLVLDDVWNTMDCDQTWNELLAPLLSSPIKGNMIIVTTRNLGLAQRIGTFKPMKLGALKFDDVRSLFKALAFGDHNDKGNQTLERIGSEIIAKLKGSPLAAKTAGNILRKHLSVDHWSNILKNEDWKSLQHSTGIMLSLKLSYDQLPYKLQKCFLFCSIFPYDYRFLADDLINIWISQGFVRCDNSSSKIEDTGQDYLNCLEDWGFFEQANTEGCQIRYVMMPTLIHEFARLVSRTECAVIDSVECNDIPPTIHHLSILIDSAYHNPQYIQRFDEKLRSVVTSVKNLRTLLLIGKCNHFFLRSIQHIFEKAKYLRMLQISSTHASSADAFLHNLVNSTHIFKIVHCTHLRYLKVETKDSREVLHIPLSKFYHLEILDAGDEAIPDHMNGLVSLRRLVVKKGLHSSITGIDETGNPQESHNSGCFKIRQLQSMNMLVHLGMFQLGNVSRAEVDGAKVLRDKQHLEKLHLSWQDTKNRPSTEHFTCIAKDVLEDLEPHHNLKHLRISWYSGDASPAWFATSAIFLRTLHLDNCRGWETLSLKSLPFLTKLNLSEMWDTVEISVPLLEELVLFEMPKLEMCSCNFVKGLSSSLRVLTVISCHVLKSFPLFESCEKFNIEQKSWLSCLDTLTINDCPQLKISNNLPPSSTVSDLSIWGVLEAPEMRGSSRDTLTIGSSFGASEVTMDDKSLAYHNLRMLTKLTIHCPNRVYISVQGFRQLVNLKYLEIRWCKEILSSYVVPDPNNKYMAAANCSPLPSLKDLCVWHCGITGKCLSELLRHVQAVEEFRLWHCKQITALSIEEDESNLSDLCSDPEASSSGYPYNTLARPASDGLLHMPSNLLSSVKKMSIENCDEMTYQGSKVEFARFTSLEELSIRGCPDLILSLANGRWFLPFSLRNISINESPETMQLCFPENRSCLNSLLVLDSPRLKSLQLHSCTALEELKISGCESLAALEGLHSLGSLRLLGVYLCPSLPPSFEHLSRQRYELCSRLECLEIDEFSFLSMPFCMRLTSLKCLKLEYVKEVTGLTDEQERALRLLTSLQAVEFNFCKDLRDLPEGLHSLPFLKKLDVCECPFITRLPEQGLPPSLEELVVYDCSDELTEQCKELETSKLKVETNYKQFWIWAR